MNTIELIETGVRDYHQMWDLQKTLFDQVVEAHQRNFLILTEHNPVITIGKTGSLKNLLASPAYLKSTGIDVVEIDRGGDITFHGPGQIVGYPIMNLSLFQKDIHWYLRNLEETIIHTLDYFSVKAKRIPGLTGVWVEDNKICAIGVKVTRWVTMHGFALNISTDLNYFKQIIPCGISDHGVTSLSKEVGNIVAIKEVISRLRQSFEKIFDVKIINTSNIYI